MRRLVFYFLVFAVSSNVLGQDSLNFESKPTFNLNLDILSSHLWRGYKNGNSFSIQPTISINYKGWNAGYWAAFAANNSYFELDLFVKYCYRSISLSVFDYYCPASAQMQSFMEFRKHRTLHTVDAMISWQPEKIPFKVLVSTLVLGDDLSKTTGKQAFSTYIEPAFTWEWKRFSGDLFAGYTPFRGYYASGASFVNIGTAVCYKLKVGRYKLPILSKVCYNPVLEKTWYMVGISLSSNR